MTSSCLASPQVPAEQRVDPTEGYVPRRGEEEQRAEVWEGRRKAEEFCKEAHEV